MAIVEVKCRFCQQTEFVKKRCWSPMLSLLILLRYLPELFPKLDDAGYCSLFIYKNGLQQLRLLG
ncbi:hypothetical protein [Photorhabdus namnaonensis]|uniref:InsA N-terminal domain-containing protein n=1 Tax=Photorhabdus namnaonensis TaxID=1851568 RepID=A0A1B8YI17_9GAMM|nr:hypothetical protein [Photorhabdus namnaonensis]OCA54747.1 hypothetical protein Phpb_02095 [Photorhabdus namnaonensis]